MPADLAGTEPENFQDESVCSEVRPECYSIPQLPYELSEGLQAARAKGRPIMPLEVYQTRRAPACLVASQPMVGKMLQSRHLEEVDRLAPLRAAADTGELTRGYTVSQELAINACDYKLFYPELPSVAARYPDPVRWGSRFSGAIGDQLPITIGDDRARMMEELSRALLKQLTAVEGAVDELRTTVQKIEGNEAIKRDILTRLIPLLVTPLVDAAVTSVELFHQLAHSRRQAVLEACRASVQDCLHALATSIINGPDMF